MPFILDLPPSAATDKVKTEISHTTQDSAYVSGDNPDNDMILQLDTDVIQDLYLDDKFHSLLNAWKENTMFESNPNQKIQDENFQEIISLGDKAIPLIIKEIEEEPSHLVWALNIITGMHLKSPVRLNITQSCKKWVQLYKKGYLDSRN